MYMKIDILEKNEISKCVFFNIIKIYFFIKLSHKFDYYIVKLNNLEFLFEILADYYSKI